MILFSKSNFLPNFDKLQTHLESVSFDGEVNPVDGVLYPDISTDIPHWVLEYIHSVISDKFDIESMSTPFMRRMTDGLVAPHQAHSDRVMGTHSVMFYLTDPKGRAGTALLKHIRNNSLKDKGDLKAIDCFYDTNNYIEWEEVAFIGMEKNKICIFHSDCWHRAEPVQGYGKDSTDSRIVLTWFFTATERT